MAEANEEEKASPAETVEEGTSRREFLAYTGAAIAAGTLTSCSGEAKLNRELPTELTAKQLARRRSGRSQVSIIKCESYEHDLWPILKNALKDAKLPDFKNAHVVLKPNMVEYREGSPVTTNPAVLKAAIELVKHLGAGQITVAEGPGHMRDTEYLLEVTGLGKVIKEAGVPYVDLNLDDIEAVDNSDGLNELNPFYLPKTIVRADAVVSVPKLKTHHWVGMTCSMKNLFGTVPGRKYGWPKNMLHIKGIPHSIIDLQHLVKPKLAVVDAIVAMEGDGPINGTAKPFGYLVVGEDLAAVDATCARMIKLEPNDLPYIKMAGKVVGNIESKDIDLLGPSIADIAQVFALPITMRDKSLLKQAAEQGS
ncbi:MAG TPA: DUF362 domain-containing protein [Candidatus Obscuribacter sp.]|nr:DUF362 domain-containing protein [Candidatus Obscuribacter sp.]